MSLQGKGDFNIKDLLRLFSAGYEEKIVKSVNSACICGVVEQMVDGFEREDEQVKIINQIVKRHSKKKVDKLSLNEFITGMILPKDNPKLMQVVLLRP